MNAATFSRPPYVVPVTRLRLGRVVLLAVVTMAAVVGGAIWLLTTKARPLLTPTVDSMAWPAWLRQGQSYSGAAAEPPKPPVPGPDPHAAPLTRLVALQVPL